jgi:hypothetical protein
LLLATGKDAAGLLGGTGPKYQWKVSNTTEPNSCKGAANAYIDVNKTSPGTVICTNFSAYSSRDVVNIDVKLVIGSDVGVGSKTDTFTGTATALA